MGLCGIAPAECDGGEVGSAAAPGLCKPFCLETGDPGVEAWLGMGRYGRDG